LIKIQIFLLLFSIFTSSLLADKNIFDRGFDFKEGIVHYKISGSESGSKTLYIKDYGKTKVIYTNKKSTFMRKDKSIDNMTYITPKWIYKIDLDKNTATKLPNLKYLLFKKFQDLSIDEKKQVKINFKKQFKGKVEKIAGYECNYKFIDGKNICLEKNSDLVLKTETNILGFHTKSIATSIEKKALDEKIFTLSKNLKIIPSLKKERTLYKKADKIINSLKGQL